MTDVPAPAAPARPVLLVVDVANTLGARPDGWWRDRLGATGRLLASFAVLVGHDVTGPDGEGWRVERLLAVVEGAARTAEGPSGVEVVRARGSGDDALVECVAALPPDRVVVVTADRGLRARLPSAVRLTGPGWLRDLADPT